MAKVQPLQVLTANHLRTGNVLYWSHAGWVEELAEAEPFSDSVEADAALAQARQFVADRVVVNPYLFAVEVRVDSMRPLEEREIIRAAGPTVRADTGKQAQAARHV